VCLGEKLSSISFQKATAHFVQGVYTCTPFLPDSHTYLLPPLPLLLLLWGAPPKELLVLLLLLERSRKRGFRRRETRTRLVEMVLAMDRVFAWALCTGVDEVIKREGKGVSWRQTEQASNQVKKKQPGLLPPPRISIDALL
jgi:hypothetical protein